MSSTIKKNINQEEQDAGQEGRTGIEYQRIIRMVYIDNIYKGLLVFPLIAVVFTLPYAVFQYNRYGSVSKYRTLIIYSFILYMLIAFFMVILPLPDRASTAGNTWQEHLNLIPFRQIWLYWHDKVFGIKTLKEYLVSMSLWQLLFNILLTVPFGVYMRYYFKLSLKRTILYSFLLSLFYETTQITALFGIYPGPYRLADVEDLICNTMGGAGGYYIASVFAGVLPSRDEIDEMCRAHGTRVTGMRRVWAAVFDYVCIAAVYIFLLGAIRELDPGFTEYTIYGEVYSWSFFCITSLLQVLITKGSTLGHAACKVILVSEDGSMASAGQLIKRYLYLWLFTELPLVIAGQLMNVRFAFIVDAMILLLLFISRIYFFIYFINVVLKKGRLMPHDKLSRTLYMAIETAH